MTIFFSTHFISTFSKSSHHDDKLLNLCSNYDVKLNSSSSLHDYKLKSSSENLKLQENRSSSRFFKYSDFSCIVNKKTLNIIIKNSISFSVTRRLRIIYDDTISLRDIQLLENFAKNIDLIVESVVFTQRDKHRLLDLLYHYKHLNCTDLESFSKIDLIQHQVQLKSEAILYAVRTQKRWSVIKKSWLKKLVTEEIQEEIYESTQTVNKRLSSWESQTVLVDKSKNSNFEDESRLIFNYQRVSKQLFKSYINLTIKVHDYLLNSRHNIFFNADIKHAYFVIELAKENRKIFAFVILKLEQLQLTKMSQSSHSADFIMSELMNITFEEISKSDYFLSLIQSDISNEIASLFSYANDIFDEHDFFENQFCFLRYHFLLRIEWSDLQLFFKKFQVIMNRVVSLKITHDIRESVRILQDRMTKIIKWSISQNQTDVRVFLDTIEITRRWVWNFTKIIKSLSRLTEKVSFRWDEVENLSFTLLKTLCFTQAIVYEIDWSLSVHFCTDVSKFDVDLTLTQFQRESRIERVLLYDAFFLFSTKQKYSTYKKELLTMIRFAMKYFFYLHNSSVFEVLHIDHRSLVFFLKSDNHESVYAE